MAQFHPAPIRFDAVLIGSDVSRGEAAVLAAGGVVRARAGWDGAVEAVEGRPVLVVEAEGTDEAVLADALPRIARTATLGECAVVVSFDATAIDVVAANLWGRRVELLCQPDPPERVTALARAGGEPVAGMVREGGGMEDADDSGVGYRPEPPGDPGIDAAEVRRAIRARHMRGGFFEPGLFADPAWDMLLDLYAAELEDTPVSVSSLCIAAGVAPTTALRWIARMVEDGLIERRPDATDRRRAHIALTEVAREGMRGYLLALRRSGLRMG